jgi:hypothetical protein
LVDDYNNPLILELLRKDEDELLQGLWNLHTVLSDHLPNKIGNFNHGSGSLTADQNAAEFHRISLLRLLVEFVKGKKDFRQHRTDLGYTLNYNNNIYGSMLGISGSRPFGTFNLQTMIAALSKSPLFANDTLREQDIMELSAQLMTHLPIGIPVGHLVCYSSC